MLCHAIGPWKKGNPCCKVAKIMAELSSVLCKVEFAIIELGYLAEEISGEVWKVQCDFSLMFIVNFERKEVNGGRNC